MEENIQSNIEEKLIYEDEYESLNEQILSQISQMQSHNQSLLAIKQSNEKKMSKLKLLLYQKFFNIIFSIVSQHFHTHFTSLVNYSKIQLKGYVMNNKKYKLPQFYIKNMVKHKERQEKLARFKENHNLFNRKRQEEKQAKKKTNAEIEYEHYQEKTRLAKITKEERNKVKMDLMRKEAYADNIYKYIVKRRFFRVLKLSLELSNVAGLFIDNINNKITMIGFMKKMQIAAKAKLEAEKKAEQLKMVNASCYHERNLKHKLILFLYNFGELSHKVQLYLMDRFKAKRRKSIWIKLKLSNNISIVNDRKLMNVIIEKKRNRYTQMVYFQLKGIVKEAKDEKMKLEIMEKLKNKAKMLLNDFNN